ncbi:MAG: BspA family leucine-rich repeat surface protein [Pseudomonadales bacterium]|nr:BspA family leucine-rich repeat surface protein [Pseudomonadales bacterium]
MILHDRHTFSRGIRRFLYIALLTLLASCGGGNNGNTDTFAPIITLNGDSSITVIQGDSYIEQGAVAIDDRDGVTDITESGHVDTSTIGDYTIRYTAIDNAGNKRDLTRTVNVVLPPDTTPPVITLNGDSSITVIQSDSYIEQGAIAIDDRDGLVDVTETGSVDTGTVGDYTITYAAIDNAENKSDLTRTVNVVLPSDTTTPLITLNGDSSITVIQGNSYIEQGAVAIDDRDGAIDIAESGHVDTSTVGDYTITYTAIDNAGNKSALTRTVNVVLPPDTIAPVITLNGDSSITVIQGDSYIELGAVAIDNRDGVVTVSATEDINTNTVAVYTINYTATDGAGNTSNLTRTIVVKLSADAFVTTWQTRGAGFSENNQIKIGTIGAGYNYQVFWGDGLADNNIDGDITHSYATEGIYTLTVTGDFPQIFFDSTEYDNGKILSIEQWGNRKWQSMRQAFYECRQLKGYASDIPDLTLVNDMSFMFFDARAFNQDLSSWDVSTATNMSHMFAHAQAFDQDLNSWDVSAVTNMSHMFDGASVFNQDLNNWSVSKVTNMSHMFVATIFNQDLSSWDVSAVTDMNYMFSARSFNQDISGWDVSAVTDMSHMFSHNRAFNQDISNWDVSAVVSMEQMFMFATSFNQDLNSWDVSAVNNMNRMFFIARSFNQDLSYWDVSAVTNMGYMFSHADTFNQDISRWDVSAVTNMRYMFFGDEFFNQDLSRWNVSAVTDMNHMFSHAKSFNHDLGSWDVSAVTDMSRMFSFAESFNQDLSNWNVSTVTEMSYMFYVARSFDQDLNTWNVSAVTDMRSMFAISSLSTANYDALLLGWSIQSLQHGVVFGAGDSTYTSYSQSARDRLVQYQMSLKYTLVSNTK